MIFIFFLIVYCVASSEISIYYTNSSQYRPKDGVGGLTLAVNVIKRLNKRGHTNPILLMLDEDDSMDREDDGINREDYINRVKVLNRAEVVAALANTTHLNNLHTSIEESLKTPYTTCNVREEGSIVKFFDGYKIVRVDDMVVAIIGYKRSIPLNSPSFSFKTNLPSMKAREVEIFGKKKLAFSDPITDLKRTINFVKSAVNPNLIIILTDAEDIWEITDEKNILVIPRKSPKNIDKISKNRMVARSVEKNQLGLVQLSNSNNRVTNFVNRVINLRLESEEDRAAEHKFQTEIKSLEDQGKKREANNRKREHNKIVDIPSVEDKRLLELVKSF